MQTWSGIVWSHIELNFRSQQIVQILEYHLRTLTHTQRERRIDYTLFTIASLNRCLWIVCINFQI